MNTSTSIKWAAVIAAASALTVLGCAQSPTQSTPGGDGAIPRYQVDAS